MVSISRYFYVQITEPMNFDYMSDDIPNSYEYLECECDLDAQTIKIGTKKYNLLSFINAARNADQALRIRQQNRKDRYYDMYLEYRKLDK